jgi:GDPmannose 4,6-dehydratase
MKKKTAFISGASGQDCAYLSRLLLEKGYRVILGSRRSAERTYWRLHKLGIFNKVEIVDFDLMDYHNMIDVVKTYKPDEFYNLAAQSFVGTSFRQPIYTLQVNGLAVCQLVDIIQTYSPKTKFYQASTSEMFGKVKETPQDEDTPFNPVSPYAIAKLMAHNFVEMYRNAYGFFGCCGILFNHESPLRGDEFVTKKITNWVADYRDGKAETTLRLGNIYSERDWGFSGDYVEAMWLMLQIDKPDTYIVATGRKYSVKDFVEMAFKTIGVELEWQGEGLEEVAKDKVTGRTIVEIDAQFYRPNEVDLLLGKATKAQTALMWQPRKSLEQLVSDMVNDNIS